MPARAPTTPRLRRRDPLRVEPLTDRDVPSAALVLATTGDVTSGGEPGLGTWTRSQLLRFGDPNLALGPKSTSGTFSSLLNLGAFGGAGVGVDGVHYVSRQVTVGTGAGAFTLLPGDILFSTTGDETLTGRTSLSFTRDEIVLFRPAARGDYGSGTFFLLLDNFKLLTGAGDTRDFALVETDTVVGDVTLTAGSFLFVRDDGGEGNVIRWFVPTSVGPGTTAGSVTDLIRGSDLNFTAGITGLDLVSTATTVGGAALPAGTILLSLDDDAVVGTNALPTRKTDIVALQVTQTTLGSGTAVATASTLFRGTDVALDSSNEAPNAIGLLVTNAMPLATADGYSTPEDTPLTVAGPGVLANDTDADGDPLTAELVSGPLHGTLVLNADGSFTYTPHPNYFGSDRFVYRARDAAEPSAPVTVTLTVTPVNDPPVAADDAAVTDEDTAATGNVLTNDGDVDGDALTAEVLAGPAHGSLTLRPDGSFTYTPAPDYNGPDSFTYQARDSAGAVSGPATVTITVTPVNDPPRAVADAYTTGQNTDLSVTGPGVLANDVDVDGDPLTVELVSGPANGALTLNPDGSFDYVPRPAFRGTDSFVYRVTDPSGASTTATVTIKVMPPNGRPVGRGDAYTTAEDTPLSVPSPGVLANDTAPGNLPLTALVVDRPANGTLTFNSDGSFTYTPNPNFNGTDSFTYKAVDINNGSSGAVHVAITVTPVDDPPVAMADQYTTGAGVTLIVPATGVLANDSDPEGDPLTVDLVGGPANGTLTLNRDGSFNYTSDPAFRGTDSFVYRVTDPSGQSATATVTIQVIPPTGKPLGQDDAYTVAEDKTLVVPPSGVLANDTSPGGLPLTTRLVTGPANGTLTFNADGSFTYKPNSNFNGTDSFTYRAVDTNNGESATVRVQITVKPVADRPVVAPDRYTTDASVALTVPPAGVLANDSDPDGDRLRALLVTRPAHGTIAFQANGSFTYVPDAGFSGIDRFTYRVTDGTFTTTAVGVTITVRPAPPSPGTPNPRPTPRPTSGDPPPAGSGGSGSPTSSPVLFVPPAVAVGLPSFGVGPTAITYIGPALAVAGAPLPVAPPPVAVPTLPPLPAVPVLPSSMGVSVPRPPVFIPPPPVLDEAPIVPPVPQLQADNPVFTGLTELKAQVGQVNRVETVAGTIVGTSVVATAGYVLLTPRLAFWLLSAVLARRAVWKPFDPLEVVYAWERDQKARGDDEDDSLAGMVG
jgi:hypothetical protein